MYMCYHCISIITNATRLLCVFSFSSLNQYVFSTFNTIISYIVVNIIKTYRYHYVDAHHVH